MIGRLRASFFLCVLLSACGGGGSSIPQPHVNAGPVGGPSAGAQSVTVSILIPAPPTSGSAAGRRALYVSTNTQSVAISVNGAAPVVTTLAPNSPNCAPVTGGRKCTVTVSAPVGTDTFAESMYASVDGTGMPLSKSTTSETIVAGKANAFTISLGGVVASIALTLIDPTPPVGTPATIGLVVNLSDASGALIVGSDPFANPVTLTDSDTSGATSLSKASLNSPADAAGLTVGYTGAPLAQAIFSASAAGVGIGSVSPATLTPSNPASFVDWPTYGYDSQRTGFNPSSTAITPTSISNLHLGWQIKSKGGSTTQPIVATNVGGHKAIIVIGNYDGFSAYDAVTGATVWQTTVGTQNLQTCGSASIAGTPFFDRALGALFVAGGNNSNPNHVYIFKLDVATGSVLNSTDVTPTLQNGESVYAHTAVTYANGELYLGTGSNCEGQVGGLISWRGRVVEVNPNTLLVTNTFFTTPSQNPNQIVGGGGVWAWGGVSADASGNIYTGAGNAETAGSVNGNIQAPFVPAQTEQDGYGEHLTKLTGNLVPIDSDYPGFNFQIGFGDLDYTGTPVIYQPPIGLGCGLLSATQGKGGTVVINNTQNLTATPNIFKLSVPSAEANYIGNPAYSPITGLLYAAISSSGNGSSMLPPGLAAIGGCGSSVSWTTQFGPDSTAYTGGPAPRSAPTVTAGGVVFMGTPCTSNNNGGCGAPGALNGAVWAVDAATGGLLGTGGNPLLVTPDRVIMAPSADGDWVYVLDMSGNLYGLTIDTSVPRITQKSGQRITQRFRIEGR